MDERISGAAEIAILHERLLSAYAFGREALANEIAALARPYADETGVGILNEAIAVIRGGSAAGRASARTLVYAGGDPSYANVVGVDEDGLLHLEGMDGGIPTGAEAVIPSASGKIPGVFVERTEEESGTRSVVADIGAENRAEALRHVSVGDPAIIFGKPEPTGIGDKIVAPHVYGFGGKLILLQLLLSGICTDLCGETTFVFPTGQTGGTQGFQAAVHGVCPDRVIVAGSVLAKSGWLPDNPADAGKRTAPEIGGGAALVLRGAYGVFDRDFTGRIEQIAAEQNIPFRIVAKVDRFPGLSGFHDAGIDAPAAGIALPVRYETGFAGIYAAGDVVAAARLIGAALKSAGGAGKERNGERS
ncbi:MAG: hypothetical protein LBO81_01485 [Clostridiales Family XIII bacterium]|jgi:putative aminopeptidase FrvX|nr:hypothetical protein [Clostridiales Family XIII bacterium]